MSRELDAALDDLGSDRRSFLKRVVIGSAFAAPVVASFTMSGVQAVYAQSSTASGAVSAGGATASTSSTSSTTSTTQANGTPSTTTTTTANGNQTLPPGEPVPATLP